MQVAEGVEGMIHVSEISAEKRINHPQDVLKVGQVVRAQVLSIDSERRLMRLSMKQLVPTSLDEYIAEHKAGDLVTGRVIDTEGQVRVELGEGIQAVCRSTSRQRSAAASDGVRRQSRPVVAGRHAAGAVEGRGSASAAPKAGGATRRTGTQLPDYEARRRCEEH